MIDEDYSRLRRSCDLSTIQSLLLAFGLVSRCILSLNFPLFKVCEIRLDCNSSRHFECVCVESFPEVWLHFRLPFRLKPTKMTLKENILICGVLLHVAPERQILYKTIVGGQHHEAFALTVHLLQSSSSFCFCFSLSCRWHLWQKKVS